jgi:branched-chain amino acid transport system permease protein
MVWGTRPHSIPVPSYLSGSIRLSEVLSYPVYRLAVAGLCVFLALLMVYVIQSTRLGRMIRAGESNREMVEVLGVDSRLLFRFVFATGVSLAAAAGIIASPIDSVYPGIGEPVLIISFVVVVIGGIGSIKGAFFGALLIGLADAFGKVFLPEFASFVVYALMAAVLVARPGGLFGRA